MMHSLDNRPLFNNGQNFDQQGSQSRRNTAYSVSASTAETTPSEVKVDVQVPRVNGRVEKISLMEDNSKEKLGALLEDQDENNGRKDCDMNVSAKIEVSAENAKDVLAAAHNASFTFKQYLNQFHSAAGWASRDKETADRLLHEQFHTDVTNALQSGDHSALQRRHSLALLADFSSAQALLEHGVEGYVQAVHKVLRTEFDDSVTITFEDLSYTAVSPKIAAVDGYQTVASRLTQILCGCCMFAGRAFVNLTRGAPPVEYDETPILKNLTGVIKPGRLTLVLGPPGCGKTSFLRAISGKTHGAGNPGTVTQGDLRYNERSVWGLKNLAAWVSYVGQSDEHQALLTVRETLGFAFKCRKLAFYEDPHTLEMIRQSSGEAAVNRVKALKEVEVDIALALLGLTNCANTFIGNANLKGVSGGERRRVTLGEMLVTGAQIMCADEISTGLDSAATFDITAYLRSAAHALQKSIVVALLQPPPEVIDLFDDIIVLAEGEIIYHGPRENIQAYFEGLGFFLPEGKDLGDFIVELPTVNGLDMRLSTEELAKLGLTLDEVPTNAQEFAEAWRVSQEFRKELEELEISRSMIRPKMFDYDDMPERGMLKRFWHTLQWSMHLRLRDTIQIVARVFANIITGLFFGTLFYQLTIDDWWLKAMLFAMALIFLVSTAFPTVQIISQQRPIFYKHVEAKFYTALDFTLAQWAVSVPFVIFDVAMFGCALYWMCGLAPHFDAFVVFLIVCITFGISMNTIMTMFPFITPNEDTGIVCAALFLIMSVVASGALSTESMIPVVFRWMMWVNPFAWSYRALAINEYHTEEYDHWPCKFAIVDIKLVLPVNCREYFLDVREVRKEDWYIPAAVGVNFVAILLFLAIMAYALQYIRFENAKVGAVPESSVDTGKTTQEKNNDIRDYQNEKYLDAVSPRALHNLAATGMPPVSPMLGGSSDSGAAMAPMAGGSRGTDVMVQTPPKTLIIRDLVYTIPIDGENIQFLKKVNFYAGPGRMAALMGSSGAGKTTLMDVISGRKTVGFAEGQILVNGQKKIQYQFVKYAGYVEQFGTHANSSTIRESLVFSANLRLPAGTPKDQIEAYVDSVLDLLELRDISDALAGTLSMEQNKRLTLGVELVANPSIIFADEPTSGLDARAAAIVMRVLLKVARSGRTVVCTIHQPSTAIFNFFDDLLLLKRGGEVVYFGELGQNSKLLVDYLEAVPGTKPCPRNYNPATWMLEVIGAGTGADGAAAATQKDYAQIYRHSKLYLENEAKIQQLVDRFDPEGASRDRGASMSVVHTGIASPLVSPYAHYAQPVNNFSNLEDNYNPDRTYVRGQGAQIRLLLERNLQTYWRSPEFSLNRLMVVMIFTSIFACFFFDSQLHNVSDIQGRIVNIFFFSSLTCIYNLYTLVPFALSRRALYYRERSANMYSVWAFNWAEGLVELPWIVLQVVTTVPLIYFLTNLNQETMFPFFYFALMIFLVLMLMTSMGLFFASLFPDALAAQLAAVMALITLMVFCGIMVPKQNLPWPYIPLYYISFFKYSSEGLMTTQFHDLPDVICLPDGKPLEMHGLLPDIIHMFWPNVTIPLCTKSGHLHSLGELSGIQMEARTFVLDDFAKDYEWENRWLDVIVLLAWIVGLRIATFIVMYNINHQKR